MSLDLEEEAPLDFGFMDAHPTSPGDIDDTGLFSPFEMMAAEIGGAEETETAVYGDASEEHSAAIHEVMKRIKYERNISASLYALSGVSECLRMRLSNADDRAGHGLALSGLRDACMKKKQQNQELVVDCVKGGHEESSGSNSCSSSDVASSSPEAGALSPSAVESDVLMWSSLDLAPICFMS